MTGSAGAKRAGILKPSIETGTSPNTAPVSLTSCHVGRLQPECSPPVDVIADETITWSAEAEQKISRAPEFVRDMARRMIMRQAQKDGHTFITTDIVDGVMKAAMPDDGGNSQHASNETLEWSEAAEALLANITERSVAANIRLRAEKRARRDDSDTVRPCHVRAFLDLKDAGGPSWSAAALARLARVPEMVRDLVKERVEDTALERHCDAISLELAEEAIGNLRKAMCPVSKGAEDEQR